MFNNKLHIQWEKDKYSKNVQDAIAQLSASHHIVGLAGGKQVLYTGTRMPACV
jgi:hypothetical protein